MVSMGSCFVIPIITGSVTIAPMEATDALLKTKTRQMKTSKAMPHARGERTAKHPNAVATPLPLGLNPKYTGYIWPQTAASATQEVKPAVPELCATSAA